MGRFGLDSGSAWEPRKKSIMREIMFVGFSLRMRKKNQQSNQQTKHSVQAGYLDAHWIGAYWTTLFPLSHLFFTPSVSVSCI
ncbi:MAG: hypothetical protein CL916_03240 [Deltaproteobacteria bacterium]|nr:hypothetical protein [Deltaproteobacteria bacterium]